MSDSLIIQTMDSDPPAYGQHTSYGTAAPSTPGTTPAPLFKGPDVKAPQNGETSNGCVHPNYTYEELSDTFTCPTCQGTGKIPRGREDDLVALIPYSDARLKPRRTVRYVFLSIFICTLIAGVLIAFLLPRPILFEQKGKVDTVFTSYNQSVPTMTLVLESQFDIYNYNFASLDGQTLTITVSWSEQTIGTNITILNNTITGRHDYLLSGNVTVILTDSAWVAHCVDSSITHLIYMQFMATLQYGLLSQSQQSTITYYRTVSCRPINEIVEPPSPSSKNL